jgi:hypothetical protein
MYSSLMQHFNSHRKKIPPNELRLKDKQDYVTALLSPAPPDLNRTDSPFDSFRTQSPYQEDYTDYRTASPFRTASPYQNMTDQYQEYHESYQEHFQDQFQPIRPHSPYDFDPAYRTASPAYTDVPVYMPNPNFQLAPINTALSPYPVEVQSAPIQMEYAQHKQMPNKYTQYYSNQGMANQGMPNQAMPDYNPYLFNNHQ